MPTEATASLRESAQPLHELHDLVMMDLDGVVYISKRVIEGVPETIAAVRATGIATAFITNNASRTPDSVAAHLTKLGVPAQSTDVVTSAQAAARVLRERFGDGASIVFLGADGLRTALLAEGLVPVTPDDETAVALSTGYGPDVLWRDIMRVAVRVREGLPWVASNTDGSIPTDFGVAPGHGVFVKMLQDFSGAVPVVAGKPERPLFIETLRRIGGERPLMVGDRLDTDILGAHRAGLPSLLVLTGVSGVADLVTAPPDHRPTYLYPDLTGLLRPHRAPSRHAEGWRSGRWLAEVTASGSLQLSTAHLVEGDASDDCADWWRAMCAAAWAHLDAAGTPVDSAGLAPPTPRRRGAER